MDKYNWQRDWWIDGMSMFCFANQFCRANALAMSTFRRYFEFVKSHRRNTLYLYQSDGTSFDFAKLLHGVSIPESCAPRLFPSAFFVAHGRSQCADVLRYCPECVARGIHLSIHQLSWITDCPVHNETLRNSCDCGAHIQYTLTDKCRHSDAICRCGRLRFGSYRPLSGKGLERLRFHHDTIERLQLALRYGFTQFRLAVSSPGRHEIDEQIDLTEAVLHSLLGLERDDHEPAVLKNYEVSVPLHDLKERLDNRFRQFFHSAKQWADDDPERGMSVSIAHVVEDNYFGSTGQGRIEMVADDIGCHDYVRIADFPLIIDIFSVRLLDGIVHGERPVRRALNPDLGLAMRMYGEPLCQVIWHDLDRVSGTAYWLDGRAQCEAKGTPWLRSLANSLVVNSLNGHLQRPRIRQLLASG